MHIGPLPISPTTTIQAYLSFSPMLIIVSNRHIAEITINQSRMRYTYNNKKNIVTSYIVFSQRRNKPSIST